MYLKQVCISEALTNICVIPERSKVMTPLDLTLQGWLHFAQHYADASYSCILCKIFLISSMCFAHREMKDVLRNNLMYNLYGGIRFFGCYGDKIAFLVCTAGKITQPLSINTLRGTVKVALAQLLLQNSKYKGENIYLFK